MNLGIAAGGLGDAALDREVPNTLMNLGIAAGDLGDAALEHQERALRIEVEGEYGHEHNGMAVNLSNLGIAYADLSGHWDFSHNDFLETWSNADSGDDSIPVQEQLADEDPRVYSTDDAFIQELQELEAQLPAQQLKPQEVKDPEAAPSASENEKSEQEEEDEEY